MVTGVRRTFQDEGSFQLRNEARQQLAQLGSDWAMELGWRDMWAFIAKNGGNRLYSCMNFIPCTVVLCPLRRLSFCLGSLFGLFISRITEKVISEFS